MTRLTGQCMCGAVSVAATPTKGILTACNCENCRRWTGGVNFTFTVDAPTAEIAGPVKTISVMPHAERGFCAECGSGIFYRIVAEGPLQGLLKLSAGLFEDGTGMPLGTEFFSDRRPAAFDLSRPHEEMTADAVHALIAANT